MATDLDKKHDQLLDELNKLDDKIALRGYVKQMTDAATDALNYPDAKVYCKLHIYIERENDQEVCAKQQINDIMDSDSPEQMMKMLKEIADGKASKEEENLDPIVHDIKLEMLSNRDFLAVMDSIINKLKTKL
jgi:hypothetical protein